MKQAVKHLKPFLPGIDLVGGHQLVVERLERVDVLHLRGLNGLIKLSIEVTEAGPMLRFEGANLRLETSGELSIEAEQLSLMGRTKVALGSGGDFQIYAKRDLTSEARIQNITANLGNVNVKANDDVRIDGERVLVNCVDT